MVHAYVDRVAKELGSRKMHVEAYALLGPTSGSVFVRCRVCCRTVKVNS